MTGTAMDYRKAVATAAAAAEARMITGGHPPLEGRKAAFAEHLADRLEFSFYAMSAGADERAQQKARNLPLGVDGSDPRESAAEVFAWTMDLFGYAIRDDKDEFVREFSSALDGWFDQDQEPGPSFRG